MSFLKKLFRGGKSQDQENIPGAEVEYKGFLIRAAPYKVKGQYQSCGVISKIIDGNMKEHRFIRADKFSNMTDAVMMIHIKARRIIDEMGDDIFSE